MPAVKRSAPEATRSRRQSGRLSITAQKSSYFEGTEDESEDELSRPVKRGRRSKQVPVKDDPEDQYEDEEEDVDNDGLVEDEEDSELDEDVRPKVQIIPIDEMRDQGGVDYDDHKLHKNTMLFLRDLKANNKRVWLKSHDGEYRRALQDWNSFVEKATTTIIDVDETIPELPTKDIIFRIYRDIRFSKDPTPYKPHFSAAWSRTGRKGPYACYYVHCEPKASFIGGGLWCPEKGSIDKLRRSIDLHPERWRRVLSGPLFRKVFLPGVKANASPDAAVKAFVDKNQDNALKKRPMGYEQTHPDIALLRLRNYTVGKKIDGDLFCKDDAQEELAEIIQALSSFVSFLNSIVMPDPGLGEDTDEEEEEEHDDDEEQLA